MYIPNLNMKCITFPCKLWLCFLVQCSFKHIVYHDRLSVQCANSWSTGRLKSFSYQSRFSTTRLHTKTVACATQGETSFWKELRGGAISTLYWTAGDNRCHFIIPVIRIDCILSGTDNHPHFITYVIQHTLLVQSGNLWWAYRIVLICIKWRLTAL